MAGFTLVVPYRRRFVTLVLFGLAVTLSSWGYLFWQDAALIRVHDTLDGLVSHYVMAAEQGFFVRSDRQVAVLPDGITRSSIIVGSDFWLFIFSFFPPYWAFVASKIVMALTGYLGVILFYLSQRPVHQDLRSGVAEIWCVFVAIVFGALPHFGVTNSSAGVPLVLAGYFFLMQRRFRWGSLLLMVFYGWSSSLLLSGIFIVPLLMVMGLFDLRHRKSLSIHDFLPILCCLGGLFVGFFLSHWAAIIDLFVGVDWISHRTVWELGSVSLREALANFKSVLLHGHIHAVSQHEFLIFPIFVFSVIRQFRLNWLAWVMMVFLVLAAVLYGFNRFGWVSIVQDSLWAIVPVLISRAIVLSSGLWYALAILLFRKIECSTRMKIVVLSSMIVYIGLSGGRYRYLYSTQTKRVRWSEFFNTVAMQEAAVFIDNNRVACVGFHPSVAHMSGIKTIGFYSSSYPLAYKEKMSQLIRPVIDASDGWRFDSWGSRCYPVVSGYVEGGDCRELGWDYSGLNELDFEFVLSNSCLEDSVFSNLVSVVSSEFDDLYIYKIPDEIL